MKLPVFNLPDITRLMLLLIIQPCLIVGFVTLTLLGNSFAAIDAPEIYEQSCPYLLKLNPNKRKRSLTMIHANSFQNSLYEMSRSNEFISYDELLTLNSEKIPEVMDRKVRLHLFGILKNMGISLSAGNVETLNHQFESLLLQLPIPIFSQFVIAISQASPVVATKTLNDMIQIFSVNEGHNERLSKQFIDWVVVQLPILRGENKRQSNKWLSRGTRTNRKTLLVSYMKTFLPKVTQHGTDLGISFMLETILKLDAVLRGRLLTRMQKLRRSDLILLTQDLMNVKTPANQLYTIEFIRSHPSLYVQYLLAWYSDIPTKRWLLTGSGHSWKNDMEVVFNIDKALINFINFVQQRMANILNEKQKMISKPEKENLKRQFYGILEQTDPYIVGEIIDKMATYPPAYVNSLMGKFILPLHNYKSIIFVKNFDPSYLRELLAMPLNLAVIASYQMNQTNFLGPHSADFQVIAAALSLISPARYHIYRDMGFDRNNVRSHFRPLNSLNEIDPVVTSIHLLANVPDAYEKTINIEKHPGGSDINTALSRLANGTAEVNQLYKSLAQLALLQRGIEQPTLDNFNPILDQKLQPQHVLIMLVAAHNKINLMNLMEVGENSAVQSSFVHFFAQYKKLLSSSAYDASLVGNQAPLGSWINIDHLISFLKDLDLNLGPQMSMLLSI